MSFERKSGAKNDLTPTKVCQQSDQQKWKPGIEKKENKNKNDLIPLEVGT